jgi:hypothetical protein
MMRVIIAAIVAIMLCAMPALAQSHGSRQGAAHTDSLSAKYVGQWEGSMTSPHGSAEGLKLVVTRDSVGHWKGAMTFPPDAPMAAGELKNVQASHDALTWAQTFGGMSCKGSAVLLGTTLRGESVCGHVSLSFLLHRK